MPEDIHFYIFCPCDCGRAMEIKFEGIPAQRREEFADIISETRKKIWCRLVDACGLEGAIEFLHERADFPAR